VGGDDAAGSAEAEMGGQGGGNGRKRGEAASGGE